MKRHLWGEGSFEAKNCIYIVKMKPYLGRMQQQRTSLRGKRRGFSLIATISILVLLALVSVGLLSLSSVTLRANTQNQQLSEARANARLALNLALGELQKLAGPDRRVTARADILDDTPATSGDDAIAQANWTGVWESWKWDGEGSSPDYDSEKDSRFLGWLVSHPDVDDLRELDTSKQEIGGNDEFVFFSGGTGASNTSVRARQVDVEPTASRTGRYAWAVMDEGQKARIRLPKKDPASRSEEIAQLSTPRTPRFGDLEHLQDLDSSDNATREKLLTLPQLDFINVEERNDYFHDLTPYSTSLLTDVVDGGFARDLSLLLDQGSLPSEYASRFLYSDRDTPLVDPPARMQGANVLPSPDPSWRLLQSHYRLYREVRDASGAPYLTATFDTRPTAGTTGSRALNHPTFHKQNIAPVIAKAQFVFSLSAGYHNALNTLKNKKAATKDDKYISWLVTDPVITLWNPYNVSLRFTQARIDLYRVPLSFRLYKNGRLVNSEYTHFANTFLGGDMGNRQNRYYRLNLKSKPSERNIVMKPGEFMVFSAHNHVKHYRHQYATTGVDLRPGFNAPAGNRSNRYVGGISTLNVCVNAGGGDSGRINGIPVRTVPLRAGDRLQVEVKPQRSNVDRLSEAGGKEVTALLKYSRVSGSSSPPLVGGIELDYGESLEDELESYGRSEMTEFVVPSAIPQGAKADDYQGNLPPPNCRFKEPFLIASLQLKSEQDARFPTKSWIHNAPSNLYASAGLDQAEDFANHQYEFVWEPMTDWTSSPTIEIDTLDRGFGASGIYASTGRELAPFHGIPLTPPASLGELRHAPLNHGGQLPLTTQVVGNSFAHPLLPLNEVRVPAGNRVYLDHSYLANTRLFDHHFLSTATAQSSALHPGNRSLQETLQDFFSGSAPLPNPRFRPYRSLAEEASETVARLTGDNGYREIAASLLLDGGFNVNSTSVNAWRAFLASVSEEELPLLDALTGRLDTTRGEGVAVSRFTPPAQSDLDSEADADTRDVLKWSGYRRFDDEAIERLAEAIVEQVKERGPFQSVAEFVNRRVDGSDQSLHGALQAAIEEAGLNDAYNATSPSILPRPEAYASPKAAEGLTAEGAPAFVNQADLLVPMAPYIQVRSDTFRIRAMGESEKAGDKRVQVVCEAIVQRVPDYLDPGDLPATAAGELDEEGVNEQFGRRFRVISFRWLSETEL